MRRVLALIFAIGAGMGAMALGMAAPAQAASVYGGNLVCSFGPAIGLPMGTSATGTTGDTITISGLSGITSATVTSSGVSGGAPTFNTSTTWTLSGSGPAYITFTAVGLGCAGQSITLSINGGSPSSGSGSAGTTPSPVIQQFGKPATGTCDVGAPEMSNIGGAESGGWSESWAEWMNGGLGGAVCTRTLVYSNALGKWVVS